MAFCEARLSIDIATMASAAAAAAAAIASVMHGT